MTDCEKLKLLRLKVWLDKYSKSLKIELISVEQLKPRELSISDLCDSYKVKVVWHVVLWLNPHEAFSIGCSKPYSANRDKMRVLLVKSKS